MPAGPRNKLTVFIFPDNKTFKESDYGSATFGALAGSKQPINKKSAYDKFAAYYNLDNGTGQICGIYMRGSEALRPIFRDWFAPFKEYNASTVTINSTGETDHPAFDADGLPGSQFIQDPVE